MTCLTGKNVCPCVSKGRAINVNLAALESEKSEGARLTVSDATLITRPQLRCLAPGLDGSTFQGADPLSEALTARHRGDSVAFVHRLPITRDPLDCGGPMSILSAVFCSFRTASQGARPSCSTRRPWRCRPNCRGSAPS